jgi:hypothetical protein
MPRLLPTYGATIVLAKATAKRTKGGPGHPEGSMITDKEWREAMSRCARPFVATGYEARHWWRPESVARFIIGKLEKLGGAIEAYEASEKTASDGETLAAAVRAMLPKSTEVAP